MSGYLLIVTMLFLTKHNFKKILKGMYALTSVFCLVSQDWTNWFGWNLVWWFLCIYRTSMPVTICRWGRKIASYVSRISKLLRKGRQMFSHFLIPLRGESTSILYEKFSTRFFFSLICTPIFSEKNYVFISVLRCL